MFLLLVKHNVVLTEARAEVLEDLSFDPPILGEPAVAEVAEVQLRDVRLALHGDALANRLAENLFNTAYEIVIDTNLDASLVPVTIKTGTRAQEIKEIVEIESGGRVVGSAIRDV